MNTQRIVVRLTRAEAEAVLAEVDTATSMAEANPGPYHPQHHAAKRAMRKLAAALNPERAS